MSLGKIGDEERSDRLNLMPRAPKQSKDARALMREAMRAVLDLGASDGNPR
jgi:hypothetical protein